jgi:hypothetical protein
MVKPVAAESRLINSQSIINSASQTFFIIFIVLLTPDHLQLLQNHHNVFLILQLILNDLMLQLVMGMGLWNRTTMVVGKTLKHNPE